MDIWHGSDLHTEFPGNAGLEVDVGGADVAVLAGDIGAGVKGIEWAAETFDIPVIYVPGNHEYYHQEFREHTDNMRARAQSLGIYFLERNTVTIDGVTFAGCTLWTDYAATNDVKFAMETAAGVMADHRLIKNAGHGFTPRDALAIHQESVDWLEKLSGVDVVVTHHCPSLDGIGDRHPVNAYTPAFTSRLDHLIEMLNPAAWIFGHTHDSVDVVHESGVRILSNQYGYPHESRGEVGWNPAATLEVGTTAQ